MRIGLYLDLRNPTQWHRSWHVHYARTLEWVEEAERQGADSVWLSEHHFFTDGYLPQPLTMAAAIAARTSRIRIGTAVLLAALRPAIQIAEEAAIVDQLSGGRLDLGFGAGYVEAEFSAFGSDIRRRYTTTDQRVREVRELFEHGGMTPPPLQQPFPIWLGYQGPQGAERAGRLGTGLLTLNPERLGPYRKGLTEGGHDPDSARMAGLMNMIIADDPDAAFERILPHLAHQLNSYRMAAAADSGKSPRILTEEDLRAGRAKPGPLQPIEVYTPRDAIHQLRERCSDIPAVEAYFWASIAGMPEDLVERHLELLFGEVRPAVADI